MTEDNPFDDEDDEFVTDSDEVADDDHSEDVRDVDVIHETEEEYVVIYPDGTDDVLPKNRKNILMVEYDMYGVLNGEDSIEFTPNDHTVTLTGVEADGVYLLNVDGDEIQTPVSDEQRIVRALTNDLDAREAKEIDPAKFPTEDAYEEHIESTDEPGVNLFNVYLRIIESRVRDGVVDQFVDWFPSDRIEVTNNGWIVDDTFIVTYEAKNFSLDDTTTHKVRGGEVVEADEAHQFAKMEATISAETESFSVPGSDDEEMLGDQEQFFLATVEKFIDSEDSVGGRFAAEVRREKARQSGSQTQEAIRDLAASMRVKAFRDTKTGLVHNHGLNKHTLRGKYNVSQDVIDEMDYSSYDHAGLHELLARRDEFEQRAEDDEDFQIFRDIDSDDEEYESRWDSIDTTRDVAVIPDLIQNEIQNRYQ